MRLDKHKISSDKSKKSLKAIYKMRSNGNISRRSFHFKKGGLFAIIWTMERKSSQLHHPIQPTLLSNNEEWILWNLHEKKIIKNKNIHLPLDKSFNIIFPHHRARSHKKGRILNHELNYYNHSKRHSNFVQEVLQWRRH